MVPFGRAPMAARARRLPQPRLAGRAANWRRAPKAWWRSLRRRGQKDRTTRTAINRLVKRWLRQPRITHPWPEPRFAVTHPRWEPGAGMPHAGFRAGGCAVIPSQRLRDYSSMAFLLLYLDFVKLRAISHLIQFFLRLFCLRSSRVGCRSVVRPSSSRAEKVLPLQGKRARALVKPPRAWLGCPGQVGFAPHRDQYDSITLSESGTRNQTQ